MGSHDTKLIEQYYQRQIIHFEEMIICTFLTEKDSDIATSWLLICGAYSAEGLFLYIGNTFKCVMRKTEQEFRHCSGRFMFCLLPCGSGEYSTTFGMHIDTRINLECGKLFLSCEAFGYPKVNIYKWRATLFYCANLVGPLNKDHTKDQQVGEESLLRDLYVL